MWLSIQSVRDGGATAVVSAGNTGALMVMAKFCLKSIKGVERPAIAAIWPTIDAECIVLDVGANVGATSRQIVEFALMGAALARDRLFACRGHVGMKTPLLKTKLYIPPVRPELVSRPRLIER